MKRVCFLYLASILLIFNTIISCRNKKYSFDSNSFVIPHMEDYLNSLIASNWKFDSYNSRPYNFYPIKMIAIANKKKSEFGLYEYNSTSYEYIQAIDALDSSWYAYTLITDSTSTLPTEFRKFMPTFIDSIYLIRYFISDTIKNSSVYINNEKVNSFRFPDTLNLLPSALLQYHKRPIIEVEDISLAKSQKVVVSGFYLGTELLFNPSLQLYEKSIVLLWGDYVYKYNAKPEIYVKRTLKDGKYKRMFEKYLRQNYKVDNYAMHMSYFELVFWQIYQPFKFKVKDRIGRYQSFTFTSNNPEYPGNYEVKFNIYEPYKFKVFKR